MSRSTTLIALASLALILASFLRAGPETTHPYRMTIRTTFPQPVFPSDNALTEEGVELGRLLFSEPKLSQDGLVSCMSCHKPTHAFSDTKPLSEGVGGKLGKRNAQPLFNLVWRRAYFWDGRSPTIRDQVLHPVADPLEMNLDPNEAARRLGEDPAYPPLFRSAFGDDTPTSRTISLALEQFLLVQISQNSRYDRAQRGETTLTTEEKRGLELFFMEYDPGRGKLGADCFHCHGNALFTNERYADTGLDPHPNDPGRGAISHRDWEKGAFKVPSLRNVEVTAPYMHDGRFQTLEEVVDHYDHNIADSPNLDPSLAKHGGPINLPPDDRKAIVAFLKTLTDHEFLEKSRAMVARQ